MPFSSRPSTPLVERRSLGRSGRPQEEKGPSHLARRLGAAVPAIASAKRYDGMQSLCRLVAEENPGSKPWHGY